MLGQQINPEAQTREAMFLKAVMNGTLSDPQVDDPMAIALADALIKQMLLN